MLVNKWYKVLAFNWVFLMKYRLWEVKCEVNPPAITSRKQKWWNGSETWNCTHLRVRSVYLGLAKRRQRRKRKKQPKRGPIVKSKTHPKHCCQTPQSHFDPKVWKTHSSQMLWLPMKANCPLNIFHTIIRIFWGDKLPKTLPQRLWRRIHQHCCKFHAKSWPNKSLDSSATTIASQPPSCNPPS